MIFGLVILVIGVLLFIEAVIPGFYFNFEILWPVILIIVSIIHMIKIKRFSLPTGILFFFGVWLFLWNVGLIPAQYEDVFGPVILILCGLCLMGGASRFKWKTKVVIKDGLLNYYGIFGSVKEKVVSPDFKGANVYSVFGGAELDFRDVTVKENVTIIIYSVFGGSKIILPTNCNIIFESTAVLGGNDNHFTNEPRKNSKTIYVNCISVFGGAEIK